MLLQSIITDCFRRSCKIVKKLHLGTSGHGDHGDRSKKLFSGRKGC